MSLDDAPFGTSIHIRHSAPTELKATVPEMHLLYEVVIRAATKGSNLREVLSQCEPETRALLLGIFAQVKVPSTERLKTPRTRR